MDVGRNVSETYIYIYIRYLMGTWALGASQGEVRSPNLLFSFNCFAVNRLSRGCEFKVFPFAVMSQKYATLNFNRLFISIQTH